MARLLGRLAMLARCDLRDIGTTLKLISVVVIIFSKSNRMFEHTYQGLAGVIAGARCTLETLRSADLASYGTGRSTCVAS